MADLASLVSLGSKALIGIAMFLSLLVVASLIALAIWAYNRWKKYQQFVCIIWELDGFGQLAETKDKAGIFVDSKTKNKRFFLKKANVGLEPDNVPYISRGKLKTVYLLRTGLKNFRFIKPRLVQSLMTFVVGEEDVNWAVNAYDRQKKLFMESKFMQLLPFITLAFISIIILIIFIYFFKDFDKLVLMSQNFKDSIALIVNAGCNTGTTIIST